MIGIRFSPSVGHIWHRDRFVNVDAPYHLKTSLQRHSFASKLLPTELGE